MQAACFIWWEISNWTPNPGASGYIMVNQSGGSVVSASNQEQFVFAFQRLKQEIQGKGMEAKVPQGLITNFPIVP
jgi:hypothetical protein